MNTQLAQEAELRITAFKEHASENQFNQMIEAIKVFDIDLTGCGFESIQAKLKLTKIKELTAQEFKAICQLFKD